MQSGVSISTMESCIDVKYGLYDFGDERELARTSLKYILTDMNDIRTKYIKLGFHLSEFMRYKYYQDFGYPTMEEFSAANLGMDKGSISRCINVFEVFCQRQSNGSRSMFLDARYSDYSYSQLCEMVSMSDDDRRMIKPDMTIKQIREKKKELKNKSVAVKEETDNIPVATSQPFYRCNFTENELILVRQAVMGYIQMMEDGEDTFELIEAELENGLSKVMTKIDRAYAMLK